MWGAHHFSLSRATKYWLEKVMGEVVQGPEYPERSAWHLPRACAPLRATISCCQHTADRHQLYMCRQLDEACVMGVDKPCVISMDTPCWRSCKNRKLYKIQSNC
jgi:hypothetical protein